MKNLLSDLKIVNTWLGGNHITVQGLRQLLIDHPKDKVLTLMDIGCGDGAMLRECSDFATKNGFTFKCIGLDFNAHILEVAKNQSKNYPNIFFEKLDVFSNEELIPNCDIALCTLFLHHFNDEEIERLVKTIAERTKKGLVINDLHRSKQAFSLFKIVSKLFLKTQTAAHDGLVSIARGFKRKELEQFSKKIPNQQSTIHWRWAYRYQWILTKTL